MKYLKYFKELLFFFISLLIILIITTLIDYISIINTNIINWIQLIFILISIFIAAFRIGKKSTNKGYIEGIKYGLLVLIIVLLIRLIFIKTPFKISNLIYYITILTTSIIGSILGKNKKVRN